MPLVRVQVPDWLYPGVQFNAKDICEGDNTCTVTEIVQEEDKLHISIEMECEITIPEWLCLSYILTKFESGQYTLLLQPELAV